MLAKKGRSVSSVGIDGAQPATSLNSVFPGRYATRKLANRVSIPGDSIRRVSGATQQSPALATLGVQRDASSFIKAAALIQRPLPLHFRVKLAEEFGNRIAQVGDALGQP